MGSLISPILSDSYMHHFKLNLLNNSDFAFCTYYVDDPFALLNASELDLHNILLIVSSLDEHVQFT